MNNKFTLILEGATYDIERKGDLIVVNGQEFPWLANGNAFTINGNGQTVALDGATATVNGIKYAIDTRGLGKPQPAKTRKGAKVSGVDEPGAVTAIMPGLIIKVNKAVGDHVEAGDVVMVLEAMKMQNELHAKRSGTVREISVKTGETVEMKQVLAIIE